MGVSLRLPHFDYTSAGGYFVTITVHERRDLLGSLDKSRGGVTLNDGFYDHIIRSERDLAAIRAYIEGNSGALLDRSGGGHTGPPHIPEEIEVLRIE